MFHQEVPLQTLLDFCFYLKHQTVVRLYFFFKDKCFFNEKETQNDFFVQGDLIFLLIWYNLKSQLSEISSTYASNEPRCFS
tara:strand:+ start:356 stop:598 length:243 start_codon:yes stop_codon:yes gene_type:complete